MAGLSGLAKANSIEATKIISRIFSFANRTQNKAAHASLKYWSKTLPENLYIFLGFLHMINLYFKKEKHVTGSMTETRSGHDIADETRG